MEPGIVVDAAQGFASAIGSGAVLAFGWVTAKLFGLWRHEIKSMKQVDQNNFSAIAQLHESIEAHTRRDEEIQRGLLAELRELKGYLRGREVEHDNA